jgi:hypothetical protein
VFSLVFGAIGAWPLIDQEQPRWWALIVAAVFALLAAFRPAWLHALNRIWLTLGRLLHRVMSPVIMGAIFFLCVTPIAWIMSFLSELWAFMRARKKYWLAPIILVLLVFGGLIVLVQGSAVAPFIYTLF